MKNLKKKKCLEARSESRGVINPPTPSPSSLKNILHKLCTVLFYYIYAGTQNNMLSQSTLIIYR